MRSGLYSPIRAKPKATIRDRAVSAAAFEILNSRVCEFERSEAGPLLSSREKGLSASKSKRPAIRAGGHIPWRPVAPVGRPSDAFLFRQPEIVSVAHQPKSSGAHSQGQYSGAAKTVEPQSRGEGDDFYNLSPSLTQGASDGGRSG